MRRRLLAAAAIGAAFAANPVATNTVLAVLIVGLSVYLIRCARKAA